MSLAGSFALKQRHERLSVCRSVVLMLAFGLFATLCLTPALASPARETKNALRVYFVDVEGGQATLFVTPAKQSLLIDTGWPGYEGRDADRIVAAAKLAGIKKIEYVLITAFYMGHVRGCPAFGTRIPLGTFIYPV